MNSVLRISDAATLALHTMVLLKQQTQESMTTRQISQTLKVSEHHLAKVMQRLVKAGLARSQRGPQGGFLILKDSSLLEIFESMDGPLPSSHCLLHQSVCSRGCIMGGLLGNLNEQLRHFLGSRKLSDIHKEGFQIAN